MLHLMHQEIGVRRKVTDTSSFYHGQITAKTEFFPARVEIRQSTAFGQNGSQIPSYATIYTPGKICREDEIILPDGTVRTVLSVERAVDGSGIFHHSVVKV